MHNHYIMMVLCIKKDRHREASTFLLQQARCCSIFQMKVDFVHKNLTLQHIKSKISRSLYAGGPRIVQFQKVWSPVHLVFFQDSFRKVQKNDDRNRAIVLLKIREDINLRKKRVRCVLKNTLTIQKILGCWAVSTVFPLL